MMPKWLQVGGTPPDELPERVGRFAAWKARIPGLRNAAADDVDEWRFGMSDLLILTGALVLTVAVCVPVGLRYNAEARAADQERSQAVSRTRALQATLEHAESSRVANTYFRREVSRYVTDVESRPIVSWPTVISELSASRPSGVWMARMSGNGPNFKAQIQAERSDLAVSYAQRLRLSPYVEFAVLPAGETPTRSMQVVGRLTGE